VDENLSSLSKGEVIFSSCISMLCRRKELWRFKLSKKRRGEVKPPLTGRKLAKGGRMVRGEHSKDEEYRGGGEEEGRARKIMGVTLSKTKKI